MSFVRVRNKKKEIIFYPDDIHFHKRNYQVLFSAAKSMKLTNRIHQTDKALKKAHGRYLPLDSKLRSYFETLETLDRRQLFNLKWKSIHLFPLIRAEMLSYLLTKENWIRVDVLPDDEFIFDKAFQEDIEILLSNLSASLYWLDLWHSYLNQKKDIKICVMFSGSLIYMTTLNALLQNTRTSVFKTEHFVSGNAFYFEEKYTHIANYANVGLENHYRQLLKHASQWPEALKQNRIKRAVKLFDKRKNKNVIQPNSRALDLNLPKSTPCLLIVAQVLNDFSIIENEHNNINAIRQYQSLIKLVLEETNYSIIFKSHPWERKKIHLKSSVTKNHVEDFVCHSISEENQKRICFVEDKNLYDLIEMSQYIISISSQALIEAAYMGRKPILLGKAYFGNKAFTHDCIDLSSMIERLKDDEFDKYLTQDEYQQLLIFLAILYETELIENAWRGRRQIITKLSKTTNDL